MELTLLINKNCGACSRAENDLKNFALKRTDIKLSIININSYQKRALFIAPALLVEDELFSYGDVNLDKLNNYISLNSKPGAKSALY